MGRYKIVVDMEEVEEFEQSFAKIYGGLGCSISLETGAYPSDRPEVEQAWQMWKKSREYHAGPKYKAKIIRSLNFPTAIRKMWYGNEVAEWLNKKAAGVLEEAGIEDAD